MSLGAWGVKAPVAAGVALAAGAAVAFGVTTPFVARFGEGVGPLGTAALLYGGAAAVSLVTLPMGAARGRRLERRDAPWVAGVALAGACVAPVLLAWGVRQTGALTASLVLNLEALFTLVLGAWIHKEGLGRRVVLGGAAMLAGGTVLGIDALTGPSVHALGLAAVAFATLAWAVDNTLGRRLAEVDPTRVVLTKGALGAAATGGLSFALHEPLPSAQSALGLIACGATGYGLSLRLYLLAQRRIGAGRTASVFSLAPFLGAVLALALGERGSWVAVGISSMLFGLGVWLHATERHAHRHHHPPLVHAHAHRHDDGHHDHLHTPGVDGEHTHEHAHDALTHDHEHAPDLHHEHEH